VSVVWRPAPYWKPLGACRFRYDKARAGYFECCSPEAHGLEVLWWAPLIGPRRQAQHLVDVHRIMKFVYSDERIEALAALSNPWADPGR